MSTYHRKSKTGRTDRKEDATKTPISCEVALSLEAIRQRAKDGLPALCVDRGGAQHARDVVGNHVPVQRCQVHKMRNVLDHLPEEQRPWVKRKLAAAWAPD